MTTIDRMKGLTRTFFWGILLLFASPTMGQVSDTSAVRQQVDSLVQVATQYLGSGQYQAGMPIATRAKDLALDRLGEMHPAYPKALNRLGAFHYAMGEYNLALPYWLQAKALRGKILKKDHPDYAASLTNLGILYVALHNYTDAESNLLEGLAIRTKNPGKGHTDYSASLNNLGMLHYRKGNFQLADSLWSETLERRAKNPGKNSPLYGETLINLGGMYTDLGAVEKAERYYQEAMQIFPQDHPYYMTALGQLASLYQDLGKRAIPGSAEQQAKQKQAEASFLAAKALFADRQKDRYYAAVAHNLATLYTDMGRYKEAELLFEEVQPIYGIPDAPLMDQATLASNQGDLYANMGKIEVARPFFEKALKLRAQIFSNKHPEYTMALLNLAQVHRFTGKPDSAAYYLIDAFSGQRRQLNEVTAYLAEGQALKHVKKHEETIFLLYSFLEGYQTPALLQTAYDHALLFKGSLLENMRLLERTMSKNSASNQQLYLEWKVAKQKLGNLYLDSKALVNKDSILSAEDHAENLEKKLLYKIPALQRALQDVGWKDVRSVLKPGEAAVEFIHYRYCAQNITPEVKYAALVLLPGEDAPRFVPLCTGKQLETLYKESQQESDRKKRVSQLYVPSPGDGPSLYKLIWMPLESILKGTKTVYYAPSGLLHRINLSAIATQWDKFISDGTQGKDFVLLGNTRRLANRLPLSGSPKATSAILYGGIDYGQPANSSGGAERSTGCKAPIKALPQSAEEIKAINTFLKMAGIQVSSLTGSAASEESFLRIGKKLPAPSILHAATHGYFLESSNAPTTCPALFAGKIIDHPLLRSGLLMADVNQAWVNGYPKPGRRDGLLTAYEISQMDLSGTELAVLSACNTGLGDIEVNEGVFGLQRAFKIAGAHYLIMSLWEVPDSATKELMTLFYKYWLTDKMTLRSAFERAQRAMRAQHEEPYYWAGFVLME